MQWLNKLNDALDYMENHLAGDLDLERAAELAGCSLFHFQRIFLYIAGISPSEYIRNRRMSCAAFDLQNGARVLDTALRYGYESPTAFNRAFQAIHKTAPSRAKQEGVTLKAYPRISFKITIQGATEMDYRIVKKDAFRIVGVRRKLEKDMEKNGKSVPEFWAQAGQSGVIQALAPLIGKEPAGILGASDCLHEDWWYYIAVATDAPIPASLKDAHETTIPACTWAVFPGTGAMPAAITDVQQRAFQEWLPSSGYEYANAPDLEVYLSPDPTNAQFEVWIPVRGKA